MCYPICRQYNERRHHYIITISLCGELLGVDSENAWFSFVKKNYRHLFPQLCSRSRFNRTKRALMQTTELLRQKNALCFSGSGQFLLHY